MWTHQCVPESVQLNFYLTFLTPSLAVTYSDCFFFLQGSWTSHVEEIKILYKDVPLNFLSKYYIKMSHWISYPSWSLLRGLCTSFHWFTGVVSQAVLLFRVYGKIFHHTPHWATVEWSWPKEWNRCAWPLKKKKKHRQSMDGWTFPKSLQAREKPPLLLRLYPCGLKREVVSYHFGLSSAASV